MDKFISIRPYKDNEVQKILLDLCSNRRFLKMLLETGEYRFIKHLPFSRKILSSILRKKIKDIHTVKDYQDLFESIAENMIENSINNFTYSGISNINNKSSYLFISNHRDITLDSALLNFVLHKNDIATTDNAVGNNLLSEKWAADLMRLNKSFIIDRTSKSKKEIYKSLNLASEYIKDSITNKNQSVWIAQKQGRSKDGLDYTDPSVLKMIHLCNRKETDVNNFLNILNIVPVSISYEKDPNDILKAKELYLTHLNESYIKDRKEDLQSIAEGIRGQKGNVHLTIGKVMSFDVNSYQKCADKITTAIRNNYKLHATNYAAAVIKGQSVDSNPFNAEEVEEGIKYLRSKMETLTEDMYPYLLNQYSNPL